MKISIFLSFLLFPFCIISAQQLPVLSSGTIKRIENFKSSFVQERNVDVWLPENYNPGKRYAVVYMHDGQMLFDSTQTWNHQEWKVDETFGKLILEKKIQECIVVAIHNSGNDRISEYLPDEIYLGIPENLQKSFSEKYCNNKGAQGKNYLKFIVEELKPYIDKNFATLTDRDHTFMMGSSLGGLISIYALCEYPDVFGGVACLSTAWLDLKDTGIEFPLAGFNYLKKKLPVWGGHKIYMDYGTGESDKSYETIQNFIDMIIRGKQFDDARFLSKVYEKDGHNEIAWSNRLNIPVEFLMPKLKAQQVISGKTDLIENFVSGYVTPRNIEVWLPENYNPKKKYAVLYMHDGQMLFDATRSWNKQSWEVDEVASGLLKDGKIQDVIVVGIWNGGTTRHKDYFPQKPFENLSQDQKDFVSIKLTEPGKTKIDFKPVSDNYLKFLVKELKPFIDKKYAVFKDPKHTFIAGSSMGGLISMYALCEYPEVFGGAACLSTHWPGVFAVENNPVPDAFAQYLKEHLPKLKSNKLYFDYGDQTLDAMYPPLQQKVDSIMKSQNPAGKYQWQTQFFPGKDHSENAWKERFHIPLIFLLKK